MQILEQNLHKNDHFLLNLADIEKFQAHFRVHLAQNKVRIRSNLDLEPILGLTQFHFRLT